jgi:hypothetical protein
MNEVFICSCRNVLAESKNSSRPYTSLPLCVWCELPWSVYKGCDNICVTPLASTKHGHEYRSRIAHFYISLSLPRNSLGELFRSVYLCIIHPYITFDHACILIIHWITLSFITIPEPPLPAFAITRPKCGCGAVVGISKNHKMVVQKLRLTTSYTITPLLVNFFPGIHILTILVALLISLTWLVFWNSGPGFGAHRGGARSASCVSQPLASNSWHEFLAAWRGRASMDWLHYWVWIKASSCNKATLPSRWQSTRWRK